MTERRTAVRLLVSTPIEERLSALEARAAEIAEWEGDDASSVRAIRLCIGEVRQAIRAAEEAWHTTRATARLTGWSEETLSKYARRRQEGEALPHAWRGLQARPGPFGGWMFRVSTIPPKPEGRVA